MLFRFAWQEECTTDTTNAQHVVFGLSLRIVTAVPDENRTFIIIGAAKSLIITCDACDSLRVNENTVG